MSSDRKERGKGMNQCEHDGYGGDTGSAVVELMDDFDDVECCERRCENGNDEKHRTSWPGQHEGGERDRENDDEGENAVRFGVDPEDLLTRLGMLTRFGGCAFGVRRRRGRAVGVSGRRRCTFGAAFSAGLVRFSVDRDRGGRRVGVVIAGVAFDGDTSREQCGAEREERGQEPGRPPERWAGHASVRIRVAVKVTGVDVEAVQLC